MKTAILYLIIVLLNCFTGYSQEFINNPGMETNEAIHQISVPGINDILSFQTLNQGVRNYASTLQIGNQNKATVHQQNELSAETGNLSFTAQSGNSNELTIGQIGSGNLMLGIQLGSLTTLTGIQKDISIGVENGCVFTSVFPMERNGYAVEVERNKMIISQNGNNNGVMAIQKGTDNFISAEQTGNNNYLLILQKGTRNSVTDYKQANQSEQFLFDKIIQIGDNLSLKADGASTYKPEENTFTQTGSNLSLEVNNSLLNTVGGVEIKQTGYDMKVVVDQSFFTFPMK